MIKFTQVTFQLCRTLIAETIFPFVYKANNQENGNTKGNA